MRMSDWSSDVCSSDLNGVNQWRAQSPKSKSRGTHPPFTVSGTKRRRPARERLDLRRVERAGGAHPTPPDSSDARRVGIECVSACSSWWSSVHLNKEIYTTAFLPKLLTLHSILT